MDSTITSQLDAFVRLYLAPLGWKVLGAFVVAIAGLIVIRLLRTTSRRIMTSRRFDATLTTYLDTGLGIVLKVLLVIAIFGVLGVETTSFAALLAAAGIAIGAAWSGLLANFAAGLFLLFLRPFKVGDVVEAAGVLGAVREIGLFTTTLDTPDNVRVSIGNNKVFGDLIRNFSANPQRRVDLTAPIAFGTDPVATSRRLVARIAAIDHVLAQPAPAVEILSFSPDGAVLAVRAYCETADYWQVYFDMSRTISEVIGDAGYMVPHITDFKRAQPRWVEQQPH
jgi:small conductance mechanosensitive channel